MADVQEKRVRFSLPQKSKAVKRIKANDGSYIKRPPQAKENSQRKSSSEPKKLLPVKTSSHSKSSSKSKRSSKANPYSTPVLVATGLSAVAASMKQEAKTKAKLMQQPSERRPATEQATQPSPPACPAAPRKKQKLSRVPEKRTQPPQPVAPLRQERQSTRGGRSQGPARTPIGSPESSSDEWNYTIRRTYRIWI